MGFSELQTMIKSYDIIAFIETMKGEHFNQQFPGYQCFHFPRLLKHKNAKRDSGGMLVFISNALHKCVKVTRESDALVWVHIQGKYLTLPYDINIGIVYIPPEGSSYANYGDFENIGESIRNKSKSSQVYICGDTNSRTSDVVDYVTPSNFEDPSDYTEVQPDVSPRENIDRTINAYGKKLIDLCKYAGLQICNGRLCGSGYTCYKYNGESVVDYLLAPPNAFTTIGDFKICDKLVYSDHCALSFSLLGESPHLHNGKDRTRPKNPKPLVYRWDPSLKATYCSRLHSIECMDLYGNLLCKIADDEHDPRSAVTIFSNYIDAAINGLFQKRKNCVKRNFPSNKWFDDECKIAKRNLHDRFKTCFTTNDREIYHTLLRQYKSLIQRKKRKYRLTIASEVKYLHERDPQGYWQFWKRHKRSQPATEALDANTFTEFYKSLNNKPTSTNPAVNFDVQFMKNIEEFISKYDRGTSLATNDVLDDILNAPVNIEETRASLRRAKINKAAGTNGIPSEFYKYARDVLEKPLTALFNHLLDNGSYPSAWCEGLINPLHKRESPTLPDNYRKVTITPAIGKLFDGILNNRLQFAKECLSLDDPFQNGFKPKASATDNIFILNGIIDKCKAKGRPLYTCFVDFKSAFDLINRSALLFKLMNTGCTVNFLSVIKCMFQNATSRVKWGGHLGEIFENMYGVLQGGVLSPNLFNLFLADIVDYLNIDKGIYIGGRKIPYLLYADDLVLLSESPTGLQNLLHGLEHFCSQWHMTVNLAKTQIVVFNERLVGSDWNTFIFNQKKVPVGSMYNYLGAIFSNRKYRFRENYENKRGKVLRAIYESRNLVHNAIGPDVSSYCTF